MEVSRIKSPQINRAQLLLVSPDILPRIWTWAKPLLIETEETWGEYYTIESLFNMIDKGEAQLWTVNDADGFFLVLLTELLEFPKVRVLNILTLAGSNLEDSIGFLDYVENWACKQGATKSIGIGRKGFLRVLQPYGYRQKGVAFTKNILQRTEH